MKFTQLVNAERIQKWKIDIDLFGSVRLGIAHFTGIDDVKFVNVRNDDGDDHDGDYKTIRLIYSGLTVIRIEDL